MKNTILVTFFLLLFPAFRSPAQSVFRFEHVTVNDGLAHSDATAVLQDKDGFIWVGTNNGIDRYDGYELKNYLFPNGNFNGLYNNRVAALHLSDDGIIWVALEEQGVFYYDAESDSFRSVAEKAVGARAQELLRRIAPRTIKTTVNGSLCIGTRSDGVLVVTFDDRRKNIRHICRILIPNNGKSASVVAMTPDKEGNLWAGTLGKGLWFLEKTGGIYKPHPVPGWEHPNARVIAMKPDSSVWVGTHNHIVRIEVMAAGDSVAPGSRTVAGKRFRMKWLKESFATINCIYEDSCGRTWVGTNLGLYLLRPVSSGKGTAEYDVRIFSKNDNDPGGINSNYVHQLFEDSFNNLWIAAPAGGLNKINLRPKPFLLLSREVDTPTRLPDNYINVMIRDKESDAIWIGTSNGFSRYLSGNYTNFLNSGASGSLTDINISFLHDTGEGTIWAGSRYNGVYILNKKDLSIRRLPDIPSLPGAIPIAMAEDNAGLLWMTTFNAGIHVFDKAGKHLRSFSAENSDLPTDQFTFLLYDGQEDVMWASTRNAGVLKLRVFPDSVTMIRHFAFDPDRPQGLKVNYTWPLLKDHNNNIWVGTIGGGLHRIHQVNGTETIENYSALLPESNVETILEGDNGEIWIGGRGLYRFDPSDTTYVHFDVADGLQSNSFKIGAAMKDPQTGYLYFGGVNGISYFKPSSVTSNPYPPLMQITRLRILSYEYSPDKKSHPRAIITGPFFKTDKVTIKATENDFTIEFVGLNYHNPKKQRYAYKLEGYHQQWIPLLPGQRMTGFSNLPSGDFTFMVKADNGDGLWAESPAMLHFTVLPPWWKTWWAQALYVLALATGLLWYKKISDRQLDLKNKIALEQLEKEKQKELSEMKLHFFTNVSHELRTPLTLILSPAEDLINAVEPESDARQKAELVHKQAQKLLELVNQLMDFRKIESGHMELQAEHADMIAFITEIFLLFKIKADELQIRYTLDVPPKHIFLDFDPSKMEIVLTNLLSNAFKYTSRGGQILVKASFADPYFCLQVSDSGTGIDPEDVQHIFDPFYQARHTGKMQGTGIGLALVREIVQIHGGEIAVESTPGKGSAFTISLPAVQKAMYAPPAASSPPEESTASLLPLYENELGKKGGYRILVVEDNDDLRGYISGLFREHFETFTASDGLEGFEAVKEIQPDIILSDVMMPGMNGQELCEKVKNSPQTAHIPVVLLTARAATIHEIEGLESGADDYIVKPFNPGVLMSKITTLLNNRRRVQEYYQRQILAEPSAALIPEADREFIQQAMKIVEENLANPDFSVQILIREMAMSQSAFYRRMKNITGQSVIEFIRDIRLKRAAQLLGAGGYRVADVINMVGMEDYKYFRTAFMKRYKVSPSEYAKSQRSQINL